MDAAKKDYDFLLINVDGADEAGHDGNATEKLEFIERADQVVGKLMDLEDVYFILTADHSTPISVMDHTGDPVPLMMWARGSGWMMLKSIMKGQLPKVACAE